MWTCCHGQNEDIFVICTVKQSSINALKSYIDYRLLVRIKDILFRISASTGHPAWLRSELANSTEAFN